MSDNQYPWNLTRVPNYEPAPTVGIEEDERLDARTFRRRYILQNRPCLVKSAIKRWAAFQKWADPDYILSKIGDVEIRASCKPRIEGFAYGPDRRTSSPTRQRSISCLPPRRCGDAFGSYLFVRSSYIVAFRLLYL
jgi:hypothetical protein